MSLQVALGRASQLWTGLLDLDLLAEGRAGDGNALLVHCRVNAGATGLEQKAFPVKVQHFRTIF